jgi:hypothetical protein
MADVTPLIDPNQKGAAETKQGSKYYGCCCDSRRAVFALNTLDIVLSLILSLTIFYVTEQALSGLQLAVWIVNEIWNAATILGAFCYSDVVVIMGVMWQIYKLVAGLYLIAADYPTRTPESQVTSICYLGIAVPLTLSVIYANCLFAYEVRRDIMSKETYNRERYSCCCV